MFHSSTKRIVLGSVLNASAAGVHFSSKCFAEIDSECKVPYEADETLINWSSTHSSHVRRIYEPRDEVELERLLRNHSKENMKIRPIGTTLSPNGIGMPNNGTDCVSMRHFNHIRVNSSSSNPTVTVGSGATVAELLSALSEHGLTLENFSSIQEQQIAGWTQVAAHGTGITLPTVEEQIIEMKLVTPAHGLISLSNSLCTALFPYAKVGLGSLGIATEFTLKCIPQLTLRETTKALSRKSILNDRSGLHYSRLMTNRHVRYMWIPYTDSVVSVSSQECKDGNCTAKSQTQACIGDPKESMQVLLRSKMQHESSADVSINPNETVAGLRGQLLELDPLNTEYIKAINKAEAEYWKKSQSTRTDDSVKILGFDCGGEQYVMEFCCPLGHIDEENTKDISFASEIIAAIEKENLPAASPIEQRWSARSTSPMSPAYSSDPLDKFTWVGVIMYVPSNQNEFEKKRIRNEFLRYCKTIEPIVKKYNAQTHWAKIEVPRKEDFSDENYRNEVDSMKKYLNRKYPMSDFSKVRSMLDPSLILGNDIIDCLFN